MTSHSEKAQFQYVQWQDLYETEKPFQIFVMLSQHTEYARETNLVFATGDEVDVEDIRGAESSYSLDKNGFKVCNYYGGFSDWTAQDAISQIYLPEIDSLIRQEVQEVDEIFFFDWRIRKQEVGPVTDRAINLNDKLDHLAPAIHVHIDQSPGAVLKRVRLQLKNDAERLLQGRVRVINVWKPLVNPVEDWPLAVCDGSTVADSDLILADHVRKHYTGETIYVQQNQQHRWHYLSNQLANEVWLFKNFDSKDVPAKASPHAAFHRKYASEDALPRESIEVRALVFSRDAQN